MSEFITAENLDLIIKENCKIRDEVSEQVDKIKTNTEIMKMASVSQLALLILDLV